MPFDWDIAQSMLNYPIQYLSMLDFRLFIDYHRHNLNYYNQSRGNYIILKSFLSNTKARNYHTYSKPPYIFLLLSHPQYTIKVKMEIATVESNSHLICIGLA